MNDRICFGGGVLVSTADYLHVMRRNDLEFNEGELIWLEVIFPRFKSFVCAVYRSPGAVINYWENFHLSIERAFAQLITNPFAPRTLPYLYFHRRFIEPLCASTFCMYMYYRVNTFYSSHPSIFVFLDAIWQIQTVNYIKIRNISDVAPQSRTDKEKLDFLFDLWRKYQSG